MHLFALFFMWLIMLFFMITATPMAAFILSFFLSAETLESETGRKLFVFSAFPIGFFLIFLELVLVPFGLSIHSLFLKVSRLTWWKFIGYRIVLLALGTAVLVWMLNDYETPFTFSRFYIAIGAAQWAILLGAIALTFMVPFALRELPVELTEDSA